ncbi:hypothetical protein GCM10017044_13910 [Kordiimonas sediminis]|uniref:Uncharacterized protein n=1 Tax=Kordiimonas sediminis TaxID=1735581 RepID=A0A919AR27_9PROT|nr:hypothetical protein [Kordiimonas sediminis]GHF20295.1 hypothetical protein GCM10017044_13910 [Kordiimonas sediminis]
MLDDLIKQYPFPSVPDGTTPWNYTLGGGGREMIDAIIKEDKPKIMLEIGCFLCASTRRWLELDPNLIVIGVDPWDEEGLTEQCRRYIGRPNLTRAYPDKETQLQFVADVESQTPFLTAMANILDYQDRFIPVRDYSPAALYKIAEIGVVPDLVYIDCTKQPDELEVSHKLWPNARITGDDWHWNRAYGYPMRQVVNNFADTYGFDVEADWATWVLTKK